MPDRTSNVAGAPTRRELLLTRICEAPREIVFQAWTTPEPLKRWWGPKGFTNAVCEIDPRPGGAIRIHMRAPDGTVYPMTGVYREIVPPERLAFVSSALDEKGKPLFEVLITVGFAARGGKTELTLRARVVMGTPGGKRTPAGMDQGWSQTLGRLAEEVASTRRTTGHE